MTGNEEDMGRRAFSRALILETFLKIPGNSCSLFSSENNSEKKVIPDRSSTLLLPGIFAHTHFPPLLLPPFLLRHD
jgi:hypothetical protein